LLILVPIMLEPDSAEQLMVGLVICFITFGIYMMYSPFIDDDDDLLSQFCQLQIFFSLLSSIMLRTNPGSKVMSVLLPIIIWLPPVLAMALEGGLLDLASTLFTATDTGVPTPCGRIGVGMGALTIRLLQRIIGVKDARVKDDDGVGIDEAVSSGAEAPALLSDVPERVRAVFASVDVDKSETLDYRELRTALRFLGVDCTHPVAADHLRQYDDSHDGKLQLSEFAKLVYDLELGVVRAKLTKSAEAETRPVAEMLVVAGVADMEASSTKTPDECVADTSKMQVAPMQVRVRRLASRQIRRSQRESHTSTDALSAPALSREVSLLSVESQGRRVSSNDDDCELTAVSSNDEDCELTAAFDLVRSRVRSVL